MNEPTDAAKAAAEEISKSIIRSSIERCYEKQFDGDTAWELNMHVVYSLANKNIAEIIRRLFGEMDTEIEHLKETICELRDSNDLHRIAGEVLKKGNVEIERLNQQLAKDKEYDREHKGCPECGGIFHESVLALTHLPSPEYRCDKCQEYRKLEQQLAKFDCCHCGHHRVGHTGNCSECDCEEFSFLMTAGEFICTFPEGGDRLADTT